MALRYAIATGNWVAATFDGGTLPAPGDIVRANGFTVTVNADVTDIEFRTDASSPAAAGGLFLFAGTRVITGNIVAGTTTCVSIGSAANVNYTGNIQGGSSTNAAGMTMTNSAGTLIINGSMVGGTAANAYGLLVASAVHAVTINGNSLGGSNTSAYGFFISNNNPTVNITGNSTSMTAIGLFMSSGTVNITGEHRGVSTAGTLINGGTLNCLAGSSAVGGPTSAIWGIQVNGGILNFTGTVTSGSVTGTTNAGIHCSSGVSNITVTGYTQTAYGNCFRFTGGVSTVTFTGGTFTTAFPQAVFNSQGGSHTIICDTIEGTSGGGVPLVHSGGAVRVQANILGGGGGVTINISSGLAYIIGNITGGDTAFETVYSGGHLTVIGNITGGSVSGANGIRLGTPNTKANVLNAQSVVTGGSHASAVGILNQGGADVYIYGSTVNATGNATSNTGSGSITVVPVGGGGSPFAFAV